MCMDEYGFNPAGCFFSMDPVIFTARLSAPEENNVFYRFPSQPKQAKQIK